jgi:hypothetical protein
LLLEKYSRVPQRDAVSTGKQVFKNNLLQTEGKVEQLLDPEEEGIFKTSA